MPRIFISDSVTAGTHGEIIRTAILSAHPALVEADVTIQLNASYNISSILADMATAFAGGYEVFVCAAGVSIQQILDQSAVYWSQSQTMRVIIPLGSNSHTQIIYSPDERYPAITCGASDGAANETAYGNALWFFDDDNGRGTPASADLSSFSTGVIAGKLLSIKDSRGGGWWDAIYAALQTASGGGSASLNDGYGKIDVAAAVAWSGTVPWDPYLPIGDVGTLTGSAAGSLATLTPAAVTNATHYYWERNTGEGWSPVDVKQTSAAFSITLAANVETSFRYRAGNPGGITGYSNTVTLEYEDEVANKRKQIRAAIKAAIEAVTGTAPYNYSWAGRVDAWRTTEVQTNEGRRVNITDFNPTPVTEFAGGTYNQWERYIEVHLKITSNNSATLIDEIIDAEEDIERVVKANKQWGGLAERTEWLGTEEEKDQNEQVIIAATIKIRVYFMTTEWTAE